MYNAVAKRLDTVDIETSYSLVTSSNQTPFRVLGTHVEYLQEVIQDIKKR